ncbi:MAG: M23 family metallopeptidase, partial [Proteobacteria bacterium]|nr:M23 family metallopeptidase [Pseudomonadota bacterium]
KNLLLAAVFVVFQPFAAQAADDEAPRFLLPVACAPGHDCWVANYIDVDPAEGAAQDFMCGERTYDGHEGTDFAVRDLVAMETGINVLAAADGVVVRIRDGAEDTMPSSEDMDKMRAEKKGCGNGVLIDHGGGWQTIYCHMKKGSITVKQQEQIKTGQAIGQVGHSGLAEFPHLHFGAFHGGKTINPFTGSYADAGCNRDGATAMWLEGLNPGYEPVSLYAAGFSAAAPDYEQVKIDATGIKEMAADAPVMAFWTIMFGVSAGDSIAIEISDSDGNVYAARDIIQDKSRARQFYFIGKKTSSAPLRAGVYTGKTVLRRAGDIVRETESAVRVLP